MFIILFDIFQNLIDSNQVYSLMIYQSNLYLIDSKEWMFLRLKDIDSVLSLIEKIFTLS